MAALKIALTGQLRAGKDAVADRLVLMHNCVRLAFGDELKRQAHAALPWVPAEPKPRELYQTYGQLMRQHFDADIWVRHLERRLNVWQAMDPDVGFVISDLRQPNEEKWARANGFAIVRVTAPLELRLARAKAAGDKFAEADLAHETEQHVAGFAVDYEIVNDGTRFDLAAKVDAMVASLTQ